jgi:hypothetical protein
VARWRRVFPRSDGPLGGASARHGDLGLARLRSRRPVAARAASSNGAVSRSKSYVAPLEGVLEVEEGVIRLPMRPDANRPWQMIDHVHGRHAQTSFRAMAREIDRTRVRLEPVTGRAHQLRLHAATMRRQGGVGPFWRAPLYRDEPPPRGSRFMRRRCRSLIRRPAPAWGSSRTCPSRREVRNGAMATVAAGRATPSRCRKWARIVPWISSEACLPCSCCLGWDSCSQPDRRAIRPRIVVAGAAAAGHRVGVPFVPARGGTLPRAGDGGSRRSFRDEGTAFLFGSLADSSQAWGFVFAVKVLPVIIFFASLDERALPRRRHAAHRRRARVGAPANAGRHGRPGPVRRRQRLRGRCRPRSRSGPSSRA